MSNTFIERLAGGLPYQAQFRDKLISDGIPCTTDTEITNDGPDDGDIHCGPNRGECVIEVKSLSLHFDGPDTWPYSEVFIDTVSTWDRKKGDRLAIANISKPTGGIAILPVTSTKARWYVSRKYDKQRQMWDEFYAVERDALLPYARLLKHLRLMLGVGRPIPSREQLLEERRQRQRQVYVRERALLENAKDGYHRSGKKPEFYEPPPEYERLAQEFGAEVPDEEWQTSPWRWHG